MRGWPYGAVLPVVVALALFSVCVAVGVAFLARERLGCVGHLFEDDDEEEEEEQEEKEEVSEVSSRDINVG